VSLAAPLAAQSFQPLAGCDCPTVPVDEAYRRADLVFSGTPILSDTVMNRSEDGRFKKNSIKYVKTKFHVERTWKGPGGAVTEIFTFYIRDQCAYRFNPGMHYLIFAYMSNGMMVTDRCEPTRSLADVTPAFRDSLEQFRVKGE
jgi:hypothetical protein